MKKWIAKKMVLLLLSVSLSVCMSGAPLSAFGGLGAQNGCGVKKRSERGDGKHSGCGARERVRWGGG